MKNCTKCKTELPVENFVKGSHWCKACKRSYDVVYNKTLRRTTRGKKKIYEEHIYTKYKLRVDDVASIIEKQNGKCPICDIELPNVHDFEIKKYNLVVDHDHSCCSGDKSCGKCVRGILCRDCNLMLGHSKDNVEILRQAIDYLNTLKKEGN